MFQVQSLLCLLASLALCARALEVTESPEAEADTLQATDQAFTDSTEAHTQIADSAVNVTSRFVSSTEGLPTEKPTTPSLDNSTYTVLIEDAQGSLDLGTLIGVVAGIVSLIGISIMIIILIVRKMGRYSNI